MENRLKIAAIAQKSECDAVLLTSEVNCQYVTGFGPSEGVVLAMSDATTYHIVDSRYVEVAQRYARKSGVQVILVEKSFMDVLDALVKKHNIKKMLFENEYMTVQRFEIYKEKLKCEFVAADDAFTKVRNIKEPYEIEYMIQAQRIAEKALEELLDDIKVGVSEKALASELDYKMSMLSSEKPSFDTILISGVNSSMPHGVPSDKKIEDGDFVTMDFGAVVNGYHSDMTRTVAVGYASDEMIEVYNTVLKAQNTALEFAKQGSTCDRLYQSAFDVIAKAGYGDYFKHALGHGVGLLIHEGHTVSPRSKATLEKGNVVTVEPGIYLPGKFGVRIEDVIYFDGETVNITRSPKNLIIL